MVVISMPPYLCGGSTMPAAPPDEDRAFLRAILNNPADISLWLIYADWLDEFDDPRAEYLRLELQRELLPETDPQRQSIRERLEQLYPTLDPNWIAIFDRPAIENCSSEFNYRCPRLWELLQATDRADVRLCGTCQQAVQFCHDLDTARELIKLGQCVAVRSGLPRTLTDLLDPVEAEAWTELLTDPLIKTQPDLPH